jgi:hypothetical protein
MADSIVGINPTNVTPLMRRPVDPLVAPALSTMPVFAAPTPNMPVPITPMVSHNAALDTPVQKAEATLNNTIAHGSGIDNIHNGFLRGLAKAGDVTARVAGSVFAPLNILEHELPGTSGNHQLQIQRQQVQLAQAQQTASADAQEKDFEAQAQQRSALATQEQAKAEALLHPPVKPTAEAKPVSLQQSYADAVTDAISRGVNPMEDPHVQQLADAQTALQRIPASKDPNKDDKYIAIQSKPRAQWSPEEAAFVKGYDQFVEKNKIQPAGVRASVMLQMPQAVVDPNDPSRVIYTDRRHAMGMEAPGSGTATAARATVGDFTHGKDATQLGFINTAELHASALDRAATALKNGDLQTLNSIAQHYNAQTGKSAPLVFQSIKTAAAGEFAKAFTGSGATVPEIQEVTKAINDASSPNQLHDVVKANLALLADKKGVLKQQFEMGRQGKANFSGSPESGSQPKLKVFNPKTGRVE